MIEKQDFRKITYGAIAFLLAFFGIIAFLTLMSCNSQKQTYSGRYQSCKNLRN